MGILKELTIKHLLMNKRRTLVTIIGIILSTALMVGIGLLFSSLYQATYEDALRSYGDYHVVFNNIDSKTFSELSNNLTIKETYYEKNIGYSYLEGGKNDSKPYLLLKTANDKYLQRLNLVEGRLPQNTDELIISQHIISNGGVSLKVGDTITLKLGYRVDSNGKVLDVVDVNKNGDFYYDEDTGEISNTIRFTDDEKLEITETKNFKIVGLVERPVFESHRACGYSVYTIDDDIKDDEKVNGYVIYKKPNETYKETKKLVENLGIYKNQATTNNSLLYYYGTSESGNFTAALAGMMSIALGLLSSGCIIVIYNSFAISTMERKKQFGLLSSIGATKRQIRNSVIFEAILVGAIGIIIGTLGAFLGIYIVLEIMNYLLRGLFTYKFYLCINPLFIGIPLVFMLAVILISAWIPAKRSSKITPVEAIRQNDDIKINKRKIRTGKLVRKVFGIEGEIALKNIKRNKKKYRITIISLFISIVMYISFSSYLQYGVNSSEGLIDRYDYDTIIMIYERNQAEKNRNLQNEFINIPYIDKCSIQKTGYSMYNELDKKYYNEEYYQYINDKSLYRVEIIGLRETEYRQYIEKVNANYGDAILLNRVQFINDSNVNMNTKAFKEAPQSIELTYTLYNLDGDDNINNNDENEVVFPLKINNIKLTEETIFGLESYKYETVPTIILNEEKFNEYVEWDSGASYEATHILVKATDIEKYAEEAGKIQDANIEVPTAINNITLNMQQEKNLVLAIKILLYGLITLVVLIGVSSVFNTISTSISLRKKEFAMLRSVGLTPRGFNKILFFESLFFGIKSLIYSLPVSFAITYLIAMSMENLISFGEILMPWNSIITSVVGVFVVVLATMMYSSSKIKKENILESIRQENI